MKILVADDNRFYCEMLKATLQGWGYEVLLAGDGEAAWDLLQGSDAPRLAILDWMMPRLTGPDLCRRLRATERGQGAYVLLLTSKTDRESAVAALQAGADDFMCKPFDRNELQARLRTGRRIVDLQSNLAAKVRDLEIALSGAQKLEAVGRLAGGVAHDFNNLLTIVTGASEMIALHPRLDPDVADLVGMIRASADRGSALTRQLLAFSRKQVLVPKPLRLDDLVHDLDKLLRRLIGEDVELETTLDPTLGLIEADPGQIEQVIINLAINARDAMPLGGTLTLSTGAATVSPAEAAAAAVAPGPFVRLRVADTGDGMDEATLAHIFEPFFTTKGPGKGTGLGLATVLGIVQQSGGFVRVDSAPGRGATFDLYFPQTDRQAAGPGTAAPVARKGHGETVLLVEDEAALRHMVRHTLESHNYQVLEAGDGVDALRLCEHLRDPIHLLLTDLVMPRLNGHQLATRLTDVRPGLKVLYMSGYTNDAYIHRRVLDAGLPFLQKPFSPALLTCKVREVLDC